MENLKVTFRHLNSLAERRLVFPLYHQLNPRMEESMFHKRMEFMMTEPNYRLLGVYLDNELVGISGYWISHKLYCGKYLEPDNVVVHRNHRSKGIGEKLQSELERIAAENGCNAMMLDAYLENEDGHRFYERHGYVKKGFHFVKKL